MIRFQIAALVALLSLTGCAGAPLSHSPRPDASGLESARITGLFAEPIQLDAGRYVGEPLMAGSTSRNHARLVDTKILAGDFDGDRQWELAAIVFTESGGTGRFMHLVVFEKFRSGYRGVASQSLGDRTQLIQFEESGADIVIDYIGAAGDDASCCPTHRFETRVRYDDGSFELTTINLGKISMDVLADTTWRLQRFSADDPGNISVLASIIFDESTVAGGSGCNPFRADIEESQPMRIAFSGIATTRRRCPPPESTVEQMFLERLALVSGYAFVDGMLGLEYEFDSQMNVMLFTRSETGEQ